MMKSSNVHKVSSTNRRLPSWLCGLVIGAVLFCLPRAELRAAAPDFSPTNWPPTQEWSDLTNNLWQCYSGIVLRCQAANISTNDFAPPTNCWPMYEYTRFAAKLSEICPEFACQTNANTNGTFHGMPTADLTDPDIPTWTASNLFIHCGISNYLGESGWWTNAPVTSWELVNHVIQTQVVKVITTLVWTVRGGDWASGGITNYNTAKTRQVVSIYSTLLTNAQFAFTSLTETNPYVVQDDTLWGSVSGSSADPRSWYHYWTNRTDGGIFYWNVKLFRVKSKILVDSVWSNDSVAANVEFYGFGCGYFTYLRKYK